MSRDMRYGDPRKYVFANAFRKLKALHPDTDDELLGLWACQLDITEQILRICKKHNLRIWAEGGTMLGAVRHKGFIPWDDDMDFFMLRPDYDKLVKIAPTELSHPYFFQSAKTEKGYFRGHAQVRNSDTAAILPYELWQNFNQGVFVDIFVFDVIPEDQTERKHVYDKIAGYQDCLTGYLFGNFKNRIAISVKKGKHPSIQPMFGVFKEMEDLVARRAPQKNDWVSYPLFNLKTAPRYMRRVEDLEHTIWMDFEYLKLPIPSEYHKFLTNIYGDYMTPKMLSTTHGTLIVNLGKPYKKILHELREKQGWRQKIKYLRF